MSRYIDADDVLELLDLMYDNQADKDDPYNVGVIGVTNYIKHRAPSIEIIRCGECKMWMSEHLCQWWSRYGTVETDADDFCSYGEREDE